MHGIHLRDNSNQFTDAQGLSAHADYLELTEWIGALPEPPAMAYLVHGESKSRTAFKQRLDQTPGWNIRMPELNETCDISSG